MAFLNIYTALLISCLTVISADKQHPVQRSLLKAVNDEEQNSEYWNNKAQNWLAQKLSSQNESQMKVQKAKNVILFLGDGMSVHTVTAARSFLGDASYALYFDQFPYVGLSRTYCVDKQVADSACSATAYLGGVKGNYGTIGVNGNVLRGNCSTGIDSNNYVESIAKWAQDAGKSAGLVTTARVTHASPAGVYAHTADRDWEYNKEVLDAGCDDKQVPDIARQLVEGEVGKRLKVIMGGGRRAFRNNTVNDEEGYPNRRTDGRNLINEWLASKNNSKAQYVWSRKGLSLVDLNNTDYLLGLFSNSHCPYNGDLQREGTSGVYPTLTEMTEAAVKVLQRNNDGYFLFVEGARIDMAHHDVKAHKALEDTLEFSNAIKRAREMTSVEDTLIVVTADHAHTMTVNGYPARDAKITGLRNTDTSDGIPHTILSYANGPGYVPPYSVFREYEESELESADFQYPSTVPLDSETHGGDDVAIFASGPYAQYFSGNYEESNIAAMMAHAAKIGPYANVAT